MAGPKNIDWSDLRTLYLNRKKTPQQIAEHKGCRAQSVIFQLRRQSIPLRRQLIPWPVEDMKVWYEKDGLSVTDIATRLGRSPKLVWKVCKKHGFHMRPIGSCPGNKNPSWNGGRIADKSGYILVHMPNHPNANSGGYVREHRLIAEKVLGRYLLESEVVHHKDDNPANNDPGNLVVYGDNGLHLADTLSGKTPNWTEAGRKAIADGVRKAAATRRSRSLKKPDVPVSR